MKTTRFAQSCHTLIESIIIITGPLLLMLLIFWLWNIVKFASCDFESNYRCEVIHGVGIVVPPTSIITVWFDTDKK